jgi:hypothetical protein
MENISSEEEKSPRAGSTVAVTLEIPSPETSAKLAPRLKLRARDTTMGSRPALMSKQIHTRSSFIVVAAALIAVALPVTVVFSREDHAASETAAQAEVALSVPAYSIVPTAGVPALIGQPELTGDAAQSAAMVLVGTLLIGLGSIVRKSV